MISEKIAFIGGGMMAEGVIKGLTGKKIVAAKNIYVYDILHQRLQYLHDNFCVNACTTMREAVLEGKIIVVAVKPQDMKEALKNIADITSSHKRLIVSVAAGVTIDAMEKILGCSHKIVRVMPNPLIGSGHGVSALAWNHNVSKEEANTIQTIMEAIGHTAPVKEELFDAFTGYCCSGGAYIFEFINSMVDAGVLVGFSREQSLQFTLENMLGAAYMIRQGGDNPSAYIERMTSPAGTTISGLHVLNSRGFKGIVQDCVKAAVRRGEELGDNASPGKKRDF